MFTEWSHVKYIAANAAIFLMSAWRIGGHWTLQGQFLTNIKHVPAYWMATVDKTMLHMQRNGKSVYHAQNQKIFVYWDLKLLEWISEPISLNGKAQLSKVE